MFTVGVNGSGGSNPQSVQSNPQSVESNLQSEESNPQSVQSNPQSVQSNPQSVQSNPQSVQSNLQSVQSNPQSVQSNPQSVQSNLQTVQSNPQTVQSNPQSVLSNPQSVESKSQSVELKSQSVESNPQIVELNPQIVELNPQIVELNPQSEELKPDIVQCNIYHLFKLFPIANFRGDFDNIRKNFSSVPPGADHSKYVKLKLKNIMDPSTKKTIGAIVLPTHQIFNNPNISITPSSPLVKQPTITNRQWGVQTGCSPPVSIVPVSCEQDKSAPNSKETQKNNKRTASYPISNRTIKKPRISITKPPKASKDYKPIISNQVVNHQIKKNDTMVSSINAATLIPSTSNAVIRSSQEITCIQSINEEQQPSKPELNCKEESPRLNINKNDDGILKKYFFMTDNQFKFDDIGNKSGFSHSNQEMLRIQTKNEMFEITRPEMMDELLFAVGMVMKKTVTKEELETLKQNSDVLQSPKLDWSSETKNVTSTSSTTSSTTSPASHNNISNSKNQSNQVSTNKSQRHTINIQQPPKQIIQISNITKQQSASSTISSKMQHSTIKQTDIKHHVSNSQPNNTSLKHLATTKHIQTSNKQKVNSKPLPVSPKHPISTTKKVVNQNVKPIVTYQSLVKDVKMCIKCKSLSEDEVCAACRMASHLKNVTVTRIETPSTSAIIAPEIPIITPVKPIDVPSCSVNSVSPQDPVVLLSSSEEEDDDNTLEPIISKVETTEALNKYIGKLTLNPKLLEDKLWQKDLSIKDYFKIEDCQSVHIGSFDTVPARSGDMLVCLHGIRMVIRNPACEPVTIDLQMDNVVKILGFYGEKPLIIIYTDHLAAIGIQYLLNMNQDNKTYFYDPLSKDAMLNKIVWFFNLKRIELAQLEKLLKKLPKKKYGPLTVNQAHKILSLHKKEDEEIKRCAREEQETADSAFVLLVDKLTESTHTIKVLDYKMLSSSEFLNDILFEFYMDYVYTYELSEADRKRTSIFSTYFYTALSKPINLADYNSSLSLSKIRHQRVKKWTKNVKIFEKDFIFIPINESAHWYMAVICYPHLSGKISMKDGTPVNTPDDLTGRYELPPIEAKNPERTEADPNVEDLWLFDVNSTQNYLDKRGVDYETDVANYLKNKHTPVKQPCILILDSISGGVNRARVTATLRDWMEQEYISKYNDDTKDFSPKTIKASLIKVPQQPNFVDCGLFALHYFKLFFKKPIVDYTFPICYLENWFHPDEVSKDSAKRRELRDIILARMKERGSVLPLGFKLPVLDFTPSPTLKSHPYDISNSTNMSNRQSSSNPSYLPNRFHPNAAHNSPRPSTSQNQPKHPNPSLKFPNHFNRNNIGYHNNHQYYDDHNEDSDEESIESIDEDDVNRQFNENDHYDEDFREPYEEDEEYDDDEAIIQEQAEYLAEMVESPEHEDVDEEEDLEHYDNEPINAFHRNMHANNGNVPYVDDPHPGLGIHRGVAHPNENFQLLRPNNRNLVFNDNDEYDEIVDEDEGEDINQIHHHNLNHDIDDDEEDDYPDANPRMNHHRRNNHFNHRRLSN
ncbi:uncharacterized protein LOC100163781 isoform X3 [Acyrthosiphon pisum]|uniref:Ubiquitin-like protease family profile domain-containing protein n=1 Tax=Acyrthosiphon pisum TaxID=7029 RepID=A0A8R2B7B1_ACYPI|nr:uncharacterized protein LOC100163781 isoform X3 [Acyrthosiphon pisum]|eukprot:XP_008184775.1 PREDICTED: uncharacterized protein LOC100163781 isoform X3 [Acyrthosiphon pisum]